MIRPRDPKEPPVATLASLPLSSPANQPDTRVREPSARRVAERVLSKLTKSEDPVTREAARLARAYLWLTLGRRAAALRALDRLSEQGSTPTIRQLARDVLHNACDIRSEQGKS